MAIFFKIPCPACGKSLKVSDNLCGKSRACPYCRGTVRIPDSVPGEAGEPELSADDENHETTKTPASGKSNVSASTPVSVSKPSDLPSPFPSIQVAPDLKSTRGTIPDINTRPASGTVSLAAKPRKEKIVRHKRAHKSWFQSSNETASSDISLVLSGLIGLGLTVLWYGLMFAISGTILSDYFIRRGFVPYPTTLLTFWAVAILVLKWFRLKQQRDAMLLDVLPTEVSAEITLDSIDEFIDHINHLPEGSGDSFLVNRVVRGIEHFRVRKSAAETVTMMESQSEIDANNVAGSYTILKVFIWALPILGFIGTVMGVSSAVASLAGSLSGGGNMDAMKNALQDVFGGLGVAFDTTLLALVLSMLVKIPASALQKSEEDIITRVDEYCNENLLRRLNDGREGGAERGRGGEKGGDTQVFREACEQALGTQHAEMERWLTKLDAIGSRITSQVAKGWDEVNERIELQQQKHVAVLHKQQLDQQGRLQAQLDQMANAAEKIQSTLTQLAQQTATLQGQVNETFQQTHSTLSEHLGGVHQGLNSLSGVLEKLGGQQVVVQQVETAPAARGWFSRHSRKTARNGRRP